MQRIGDVRLPGRLRHAGRVQVDPGFALGLSWIVAVLVVSNSSHVHVAVIPAARHNPSVRWLVLAGAIAVAMAALALRHRQPLLALFALVAAVIAAPAVLLLLGPALVGLYTVAVTLGLRDTTIAAVGVVAAVVLQRVAWGPTGDNTLPAVLIGTAAAAALGLLVVAGQAAPGAQAPLRLAPRRLAIATRDERSSAVLHGADPLPQQRPPAGLSWSIATARPVLDGC